MIIRVHSGSDSFGKALSCFLATGMDDNSSARVVHLPEADWVALAPLCRQDLPANPWDEPRLRLAFGNVDLVGVAKMAGDNQPERVIFPHRGLLGHRSPNCTGGGSWLWVWNYEIALIMVYIRV